METKVELNKSNMMMLHPIFLIFHESKQNIKSSFKYYYVKIDN